MLVDVTRTTSRTASPRECSIASALDVVGEKWSLLVVRELFLGVRRFNDIWANTGAPRDVLTARLRRLEELTNELEPLWRGRSDLWYLQWTLLESAFVPIAAARWDEAIESAPSPLGTAELPRLQEIQPSLRDF